MDNNIVLTLCIPTNGAVEWVRNTVEGIYIQNCDESLFEVIVVDNGVDSSLGDIISTYNHQNLSYYKTDVEGFYNLIVALKYGKGTFIKVLNHRSILQPYSLRRMIEVIRRYERERPVCGVWPVCGDLPDTLRCISGDPAAGVLLCGGDRQPAASEEPGAYDDRGRYPGLSAESV